MARTRNLKPGFFRNEELAECKPFTRLLFAGLWGIADRDGRLKDSVKRIKAELFPYDDGLDIDAMLDELHTHEFITRYQVGHAKIIQIENFRKHQNPHQNEPSLELVPCPENFRADREKHRVSTEQAPERGRRKKEEGRRKKVEGNTEGGAGGRSEKPTVRGDFEEFWELCPKGRKWGKGRARKAYISACKRASKETIHSSMAEFAVSLKAQGDFCNSPESWLNGDCWEDDREAWNRRDGPVSSRKVSEAEATKASIEAAGQRAAERMRDMRPH